MDKLLYLKRYWKVEMDKYHKFGMILELFKLAILDMEVE
jgi:hypothetical protein